MKNFSVAEAFSSGVGLIERRGGAVLVWALVIFTIELGPRLAAYLTGATEGLTSFGPPSAPAPAAEAAGAAGPEVFRNVHFPPHLAGLGAWWPLAMLWMLLGTATVYAAIYRSVLQPGQSGFAYLRFGKAELLQAVVIVLQIIVYLVLAILWVLSLFVVAAVTKLIPSPWGGWLGGLGVLAVSGVTVWIGLRLALAGPMTFAQGKLRFFESWTVTKGRSWKLFWTMFLLGALVIGLEIMVILVALLPLSVIVGGLAPILKLDAVAAAVGLVQWELPVALAGLLVVSLVTAWLRTLVVAPWATAYRSLAGETDEG